MYKHFVTQITRVVDGDTVMIEIEVGEQACRLKHIDAPEKGMTGWREAKNYIEDNWLDMAVWVTATGHDRYGRWLVEIEGENFLKLHEELLKRGLAFYYTKYSNDINSFTISEMARVKGVGLWKELRNFQEWVAYRKKKDKEQTLLNSKKEKLPMLIIVHSAYGEPASFLNFLSDQMIYLKNFESSCNEYLVKYERAKRSGRLTYTVE